MRVLDQGMSIHIGRGCVQDTNRLAKTLQPELFNQSCIKRIVEFSRFKRLSYCLTQAWL